MGSVFTAALPVLAILWIGYLLRRSSLLHEEADKSLMRLVVNLFYPCLFLHFILGNEALMQARNLVIPPILGFLMTVAGFGFCLVLGRQLGLVKGKGLRTFAFSGGINNYGYIPIPLVAALFGDSATTGVLLVHNVGIEIALWTVGIFLLGGNLNKETLRRMINPPLIALAGALAINFSGLYPFIPEGLITGIAMLGACAIPLGLLLAGASIRDLVRGGGLGGGLPIVAGSLGARLLVFPVILITLAIWLPGISEELRRVLIVQAAMPAGIFPIVLAKHYGGDPSVAVTMVISTTIASVLTMPIWISVGLRFLAG